MNFTASTAFEECTVAQLQDFLRNKGLPTKGNKCLLYTRGYFAAVYEV